jgi:hypothetical protein
MVLCRPECGFGHGRIKMNYDRQSGAMDEVPAYAGDTAFVGVNERLAPTALPSGYVARAKNCRFRDGRISTRRGVTILPWSLGADGLTPFGAVYCSILFSDPNQPVDWILTAADGGVWKCRPGFPASAVSLPTGVVLTAATATMFVQCMNIVLLLRGTDEEPLVCDNIDVGFRAVVQTEQMTDAGTNVMPNASYGAFTFQRLGVIQEKDQLALSDYLDYTRYQEVTQTTQIGGGTNDKLVVIAPFADSTIVCFKEKSVRKLSNATGTITEMSQENVTDQYGCIAARTVCSSGADMFWLSQKGIADLQMTVTNAQQATNRTLSDPMLVTWGRINWQAVSGATADIWDNRLYLALPLDMSTFNNAVVVYDFLNQAWAGVDESDAGAVNVQSWIKIVINGQFRLVALGNDGLFRLWDEGWEDEELVDGVVTSTPIEMDFYSRGYQCTGNEPQQFLGLTMHFASFNPCYTISTVSNGVSSEMSHRDAITRDRTVYDLAGMAPYDPSNNNDDFSERGRQDYSIPLLPSITADNTSITADNTDITADDDSTGLVLRSGVVLNQLQDQLERIPMTEQALYEQVRVRNTTGRLEIRALSIAGITGNKIAGVTSV